MQKVLLIVLFIYFQGKIVFTQHLVNLIVLKFYFDLVLLFYFLKFNHYFSACESLPNSSCHFWKHKTVFLQILYQPLVPSDITPRYSFSSNIIYFAQNQPIKVQTFEIFECSAQNSSNSSSQFWTDKSIPHQIWHHFSLSWHITTL